MKWVAPAISALLCATPALNAVVTVSVSANPPAERVELSQLQFAVSGSNRDWRYHPDPRNDRDIGQSFNAVNEFTLGAITMRSVSADPGARGAAYRIQILANLVFQPGEIDVGTAIESFIVISEQRGVLPANFAPNDNFVTFDIEDVFLPGDEQYAFLLLFDTEAAQRLVRFRASSGSSYELGDAIERNFGDGTGDVRDGNIVVAPVTPTPPPRNDYVFILQRAVPEPHLGGVILLLASMLLRRRQ